jgi:hypothetical protein
MGGNYCGDTMIIQMKRLTSEEMQQQKNDKQKREIADQRVLIEELNERLKEKLEQKKGA